MKENMKITDLSGIWRFQEDLQGNGIDDKWFHYNLKDSINIPGIMQAQGYGEDISHDTCWMSSLHDQMWYMREEYKGAQEEGVKVPFLSQPQKYYMGMAWYQREIEIDEDDDGAYFKLFIECVRWNTKVWIDDIYVGGEISLCAPHEFTLGFLTAGEHRLTICVDNGYIMPYRPDGHGVSDALGATWNGLVGRVELRAMPAVYLSNISVYPDYDTKKVRVKGKLINTNINENSSDKGETAVTLIVKNIKKSYTLTEENTEFDVTVKYSAKMAKEWDEYSQTLHTLKIAVAGDGFEDVREINFGFRKVESVDGKFYVNGRQTYFRGTHFGGDFPLTGCPSVDIEYWKRIFNICKDWGLNFIRFHSYCPPEAAFRAADEIGIYLHVECGMWNDFNKDNDMLSVLKEETERIISSFGNHPSFVMMSPSNEPGGDWYGPLMEWVRFARNYDARRLYTLQSGWPVPCPSEEITDNDYLYYHRSGTGPYPGGTIRNKPGWFGKDYSPSLSGVELPVICHEMGQWCSYPDFDIIKKFTGFLRPGNYEVFKERAEKMGVIGKNKEMVRASGKFQVQMYKEDLEANFRTPKIYGFEILDMHDYLGQGSALVGVLDAFWDEKGYITAEEFRHFCAPTVLLMRIPKYVYGNNEILKASVEIAHFNKKPIKNCIVRIELHERGKGLIKKGRVLAGPVENGKNIHIKDISIKLSNLHAPGAYDIKVSIDGTDIRNEWHFWLYDSRTVIEDAIEENKDKVVFTRSYREAVAGLSEGKRVMYMPPLSVLDWNCPPLSTRPSFWNSQMGPRWGRGMGLLINKSHLALKDFPTEDYEEWQWENIVRYAKGFNLENFPVDFEPIVQPIDEWNRSYRMGLIWEASAFGGRLLFISADLFAAKDSPAAAQLFKSLIAYAASDDFAPEFELNEGMWRNCFADTLSLQRYNVSIEFSDNSNITQDHTDALMSCNPNRMFWLKNCGHPFTITLSLEKPVRIEGIKYMPGQFHRAHTGEIRNYEIEALMGMQWVRVAKDACPTSYDLKNLMFTVPVETEKVRLRILDGFGKDKYFDWKQNIDGWYYDTIEYKEKDIVIGALGLIVCDDAWKDIDVDDAVYNETKTITVEIED